MLKYSLRENTLTTDENDFMANVTDSRSYSMNEVIDHMEQRGSSLTRFDMTGSLDLFSEVIVTLLLQGASINTPLFNISWSIKGVFQGGNDHFDPARHTLQCNIHPGVLLKDIANRMKLEKVNAMENLPHITAIIYALTKTAQTTFAAGDTIEITGSKLKFDHTDPEQGIFLVSEETAEIPCPSVIENKPSRIITSIPDDVSSGNYFLEVRTKLDAGQKLLKHIKTGKYAKVLTIH